MGVYRNSVGKSNGTARTSKNSPEKMATFRGIPLFPFQPKWTGKSLSNWHTILTPRLALPFRPVVWPYTRRTAVKGIANTPGTVPFRPVFRKRPLLKELFLSCHRKILYSSKTRKNLTLATLPSTKIQAFTLIITHRF